MVNGRGNIRNIPRTRQTKINVNLDSLDSAKCPLCGAVIFDTSFLTYKKLPAIQSPNGKAQLIGIPILVCAGCESFLVVREDELLAIEATTLQPVKES